MVSDSFIETDRYGAGVDPKEIEALRQQARDLKELLQPFEEAWAAATAEFDFRTKTLGLMEAVAKHHLLPGAFMRAALFRDATPGGSDE